MEIKQNLVLASKYSLKCPNAMTAEGLCIHNTANDASAKNEISYMVGNNLQTSFHFAVDDIEAWQGLPLDRNGWHAGDGNGDGNRKHIGIEICYSKSGGDRFTKAEDNAVKLVAQLLKERNWGVERVKKHQDFSGKYCPHRTLDLGWDRFLNKVKTELGEEDMSHILDYLGMPDEQSAIDRLGKHLGTTNDKCDWGSSDGDKGGYLGSERRKNKVLEDEKKVLLERIKELEASTGTPTTVPPKTLKLADGDEVMRNGVKWFSGGQLEATYQEKV